jgi:polysaccharide biosynthesis protein PelF
MIISTISNRFAHPVCAPAVDVCLIAEGCYPHIAGGVSSWIDWLMRTQEQKRFVAVSIVTGRDLREPRYKFPDNLTCCSELILQGAEPARLTRTRSGRTASQELAQVMVDLVRGGGLAEYARMVEIVNEQGGGLSHHDLMASQLSFDVIRYMYDAIMPHASFLQFFWAWRALFGGLFSTLKFAIPQAGVYHAISTGYAGLLAARATLETGRPAVVTEHGIYTNERRIEILMADWISDSVDKGLALDDERTDLRDLWVKVFEAYARICYQACSEITTLYSDNQQLQRASGAQAHRLKVLANGIDLRRFESLPCAAQTMRPTMALIGRVVPIKDVKTFISAAAIVRERIPNLHALVMGPTDEDPEYFNECSQLVAELGLSESLTFTGNVRITDLMPSIHVVVLTSLSEAQPLVLLEAGAAGIPSVATNVGACREIIEGSSEETAPEPGGYVTDLVAPEQVADSIWRLITNESLRRRFGETMRQRVRDYYASDMAQKKYASLYHDLLAMPTTRNRPEFV